MHQKSPKRQRITRSLSGQLKKLPVIKDEHVFQKNKSSQKAKNISTHIVQVHFSIWIDKHYHDRLYLGDENGMRENIDQSIVLKLVKLATRHLLFYSSITKAFSFLSVESDSFSNYPNRVILQMDYLDSVLNVVVQAHFLDSNKFEITIITAMCVDDFKMATGQYCIDIEDDRSFLKQFDGIKCKEIFSF